MVIFESDRTETRHAALDVCISSSRQDAKQEITWQWRSLWSLAVGRACLVRAGPGRVPGRRCWPGGVQRLDVVPARGGSEHVPKPVSIGSVNLVQL